MNELISLAGYILLVAVAVERAVEFIKPVLGKVPALNTPVANQAVAGLLGVASYFVHAPTSSLLTSLGAPLASAVLGLSVSGGSGIWHDIMSALQALSSTGQSANTSATQPAQSSGK